MSTHHHASIDDYHYDVASHDNYPYPHHHEYHPDAVFVTVDHLPIDYPKYITEFFDTFQPADLIGEYGYDVTLRAR